MPLRRPARRTALAAAALVLAPALSSCGFNYATDRVDTPAAGMNERSKDVDVLNALIVAEQAGSGTLIAGLSNNKWEEAALEAISGEVTPEDLEPVEITGGGFVNLGDDGGVVVTGEFKVGELVSTTFQFDNGQAVTLEVPVVGNCDEFEGLDVSGSAGASSAEATGEPYTCDYLEPHSDEGH